MAAVIDLGDYGSCGSLQKSGKVGAACRRERDLLMKQAIQEVIEMPAGVAQSRKMEKKRTGQSKMGRRCGGAKEPPALGEENLMRNEKPAQVEEDANAGEWCMSRQKRSRSQMTKAGKHKARAGGEAADEEMTKATQDVIEMPSPLSKAAEHKVRARGEAADEEIKKATQDVIEMPAPQSKKNEKKSRGQSKLGRRSGAVEEVPFGEMLWGNAISLTEEMQKKWAEETVHVEEDASTGEGSTAGQERARSKGARAGKHKGKTEAFELGEVQPDDLLKSEQRRAPATKQPKRARSRPANKRKDVEALTPVKQPCRQDWLNAPTPEKLPCPEDHSNAKQDEDEVDEETEKQRAQRKAEREAREALLKEKYAIECLEFELQAATAALEASPENDEILEGWEVL